MQPGQFRSAQFAAPEVLQPCIAITSRRKGQEPRRRTMNRQHKRMKFMSAVMPSWRAPRSALRPWHRLLQRRIRRARRERCTSARASGTGYRWTTRFSIRGAPGADWSLGTRRRTLSISGGGVRLLLRRESHSPRDEGGSEPVASGGGGRLRPPAERRGARATVDCDECIGAGTETKLAAAPGLTTMFFPGKLVLSIDARYQMVFADEMLSALIFSFGIGF